MTNFDLLIAKRIARMALNYLFHTRTLPTTSKNRTRLRAIGLEIVVSFSSGWLGYIQFGSVLQLGYDQLDPIFVE